MAGRFFRSVENNRETPASDKVPQIEDMLKEPVTNGSVPEPRIRPAKAKSKLPDFVTERVNLHRYLLDKINLGVLDTFDRDELHDEIRPMVRDYVRENNFPLNAKELETLIWDITNEMLGLGLLCPVGNAASAWVLVRSNRCWGMIPSRIS